MRILVLPHDMQLGGSTINALDLARAVRDLGHEVFVLGRSGPLRDRVRELGLGCVDGPETLPVRPAPGVVKAVRKAVRDLRIDVVHTYEYWTCLEGFYGTLGTKAGLLSTVMSMGDLPPYFPRKGVPVTVGYGGLAVSEKLRRSPVHLLEPPVDTDVDDPSKVDPAEFAAEYGLTEPAPTVVIVSRLARSMKQESVERTIDAVAALDGQVPGIRAVVVGGGTAEEDIRARAAKINAEAGRRLIVLTGALTDPRPAYAFADVVAGMGSSVLRGMAYGKPAVVVGERGFSREVTPGTLHVFDHNGFHGVGTGVPEPDPLPGQLLPFLRDEGLRRQTGDWAYRLIQDRFALRTLAGSLVGWYEDARGMKAGTLEAVGVTGRLVAYKSGQAGLGERARRLVRR